jgi:hypothetical protein
MADGRSYSALELAMLRHTWQRFEEIALQAARHLQLTAWEVNFLLNLAEAGSQTRGEMELSHKQLKVLLSLEDRVKVQQILDLAHIHPGRLSAWETDFLTTLVQSRAEMSEKQAHVLLRIQDRIMAPAEAAMAISPAPPVSREADGSEPADRG